MLIPRVQIRHRLFTRLLLSYILLVTIPLLITGKILVDTAQQAIENAIQERNQELAERTAGLIQATLERGRDILRFGAQMLTFYPEDRMSQELIITNLVSQYPIFQKISILDSLGSVVSTTAYGTVADSLLRNGAAVPGKLMAPYTSEVYVSEEMLPLMDVVEPIQVFGETSASLWAVVDLKAIWTLVDSNIVGSKSEAFIFRADGHYIAHSNRRKVLERQRFEESSIAARVDSGVSGHQIYLDPDNVEMIAAFAPVPDRDWGTVVQQPAHEAFAPSRKMRLQVFIILLASIVGAAVIAAFYARQIANPVNLLVDGIERISKGDLKYRIPRAGNDEIGTLALHFNAMTSRLRRIQEKLKRTERLETLSKLSSVLSHEIRNPLNSMVINMQLLKREFHKPEVHHDKLDHYHQIVAAEIRRVDDLVSNFLNISRPPKLEKSWERLDEMLDKLVKAEVAKALSKGVRVMREYRLHNVLVEFDANRMYQVFLNIYINALQAMPGGGKLTIALNHALDKSGDETRDFVTVSFQDTGKGIRANELNNIFDFYYSNKKGGTGLGLAVALQIVEEHGGTITVKSEVDKGSTFTVMLPWERRDFIN